MKNLIILFSLSLSTLASAQFYIGPEIGTNFLQIRKTDMGSDYQMGLHGGLNAEYFVYSTFSIKSGLYFTQKKQTYASFDTSAVEIFGFDLEGLIPGVNFEEYSETSGLVTQSYLQIPLMASYTIGHFNVSAGGFMGFMIKSWSKEETNSAIPALAVFEIDSLDPTGLLGNFLPAASSSDFTETSSKENLRSFDFGLKAGISYRMDNFAVNFSYLYSIPDYRIDRGDLDIQRHSYFQASINYNFRIGQSKNESRY